MKDFLQTDAAHVRPGVPARVSAVLMKAWKTGGREGPMEAGDWAQVEKEVPGPLKSRIYELPFIYRALGSKLCKNVIPVQHIQNRIISTCSQYKN